MVVMLNFASKLEIDASAETFLLKGDKELEFTRKIGKIFTSTDFLVLTYSTDDDLLSDKNIEIIQQLSSKISLSLDVESIYSIVNVPLLQSPPRPIKELVNDVQVLTSQGIDKSLAKKEFLNSELYKNNLVSDDFKTTLLMINLKRDEKYFALIQKRDHFEYLKTLDSLTQKQKTEFENITKELKTYRDKLRNKNHDLIVYIRSIKKEFELKYPIKLHLGGANMIADDMVEFVKSDLATFGFAVVFLLIFILYILFRELRWVFIPLFICSVSIIITSGLFGLFQWEITVISSNFISLQLIMNMSLVVHLIVKYKELFTLHPSTEHKQLLEETTLSMLKPSFFVILTTIAGFSSLVFSDMLPIITFGWMMSVGIVISLITTFILFPIVLIFLGKSKKQNISNTHKSYMLKGANVALEYKKTILFITTIVLLFSISGATKLQVENCFIDYFKKETQIYQGMRFIDQNLGGTTPLDIIIIFKENSDDVESIIVQNEVVEDELDSFEDEFETSEEEKEIYWFTKSKMDKIKAVHNYLDSLEPVGKVLSLATLLDVGKSLNDGKELDGLTLALIHKELPIEYKKIVISPYVNLEHNMARISTRVIDSLETLKRDEFLKKLNKDLQKMFNPSYEEYRVSNLLVIYNNMLQSLFDSQIKSIGLVLVILFIMFLILFKDIKIAIIALIANTVPVSIVFGFMGWLNMPLDMMTITIAAISIGIAVDDTIHYIHRFQNEYRETQNIRISILNTHQSIGKAMFYTSTIIIVGFSVLLLSNFIPTITFSFLTIIAMFMAIVADLLLLPILLIFIEKK